MTIEDQIKNLEKLVERLSDDKAIQNRVTTVAALEVFADYKTRIFTDGRSTNSSRIGDYNTKAFYAGKSQLKGLPKSKFKPKGKTGQSKFKNGKPHKTTYLKNGYFQFRKVAGRQNRYVDLNLTGASERSIQFGTEGDAVVFGFTDDRRRKILEANELRFKKQIFTLSQDEIKTFNTSAVREIKRIIQEEI